MALLFILWKTRQPRLCDLAFLTEQGRSNLPVEVSGRSNLCTERQRHGELYREHLMQLG